MAMSIRKAYRLTEEQDAELREKAMQAGLSESEYMRLLISDKPKDYPEIRAMLDKLIYEVNKIGVNINEIVYNNNSMLYKDSDKQRLMAYMHKLNETVKGSVRDIGNNENLEYR